MKKNSSDWGACSRMQRMNILFPCMIAVYCRSKQLHSACSAGSGNPDKNQTLLTLRFVRQASILSQQMSLSCWGGGVLTQEILHSNGNVLKIIAICDLTQTTRPHAAHRALVTRICLGCPFCSPAQKTSAKTQHTKTHPFKVSSDKRGEKCSWSFQTTKSASCN